MMGTHDLLNTQIIRCLFIFSVTFLLILLIPSPVNCTSKSETLIATSNISLTASLQHDDFAYDLTLNCTAPGKPRNVTIQRKFPLGLTKRVLNKDLSSTAVHAIHRVQGNDCNDVIGTYDCSVQYENQYFKSKGLYIPIPDCPFKMCNTQENNTILHAAVNETVNITFCILGYVIGMTGKIQNNRERKLLNYNFTPEVNNVTLKNSMKFILIRPSKPENFGLYKLEITQNVTKFKMVLHVHLIKKEIPQFCTTSNNYTVVNVFKNTATANFCIFSKDPINRISVNDQILFLKDSYIDSYTYKLETDRKTDADNSSKIYSLQVLNVTSSSTHRHQVTIETLFNMTLKFSLHLHFPENQTILCAETINNTFIDVLNGKLVVNFCVVTKEKVTDVRINELSINTEGLASTPKYILTNKTRGDAINFTLEIQGFHEMGLNHYTVSIQTKSGAGILYAFKINNTAENLCSSTKNATVIDIINNTATVFLCVHKKESVSEIIVEIISETEGSGSLEYTNESQDLQDRQQIKIMIHNITTIGPHEFQIKLLAASGTRFLYIFYGENQTVTGNEFQGYAQLATLLTFTIPITSVCLIAFACFVLCCYRRLRARRRRDSFEKKYVEFVNEGHHENNASKVKIREAQDVSNRNLNDSKEDTEAGYEKPSLQTLLNYQPSSIYEHVL